MAVSEIYIYSLASSLFRSLRIYRAEVRRSFITTTVRDESQEKDLYEVQNLNCRKTQTKPIQIPIMYLVNSYRSM